MKIESRVKKTTSLRFEKIQEVHKLQEIEEIKLFQSVR